MFPLSSTFGHAELQAAVSPLRSFGVIHNIYYSGRGRNVDLALGYYKNNFLFGGFGFDVFAGYGIGERQYWEKTKHLSDKTFMVFDIDNSFQKYYSQASFYKSINKRHQLSFTFRASYIDYKWFNYTVEYSTANNTSSAFNASDVVKNDGLTVSCFDYMLTYKYRFLGIGFFIQPGMYINNGPSDETKDLHFSNPKQFVLNAGVNVYLGKNKKTKA